MAPVDRDKLRSHIDFVRRTLRQLEEIRANGEDEFTAQPIVQAATIRYLQTGIEALLDMANHVISRAGLGLPKTYAEAMEILVHDGILPSSQRDTLLSMVRFRNRAVHLYDEIDPAEVWKILELHLGDFESFVGAMVRRYFAD